MLVQTNLLFLWLPLILVQTTLEMCGNRVAVFDNMTKDEAKLLRQRDELLSAVEDVVDNNGGKPYTNDLFEQLKVCAFDFSSK